MESTAPPQVGNVAATAGNGAPSAGNAVATTSSMDINNGIIEAIQPSRKRMKPSSSSGETTPALSTGAGGPATTVAAAGAAPQQQHQQPSSTAKRRAPGILNTALGWARSQAADLASFQETKANEGPEKPLPPLPLPTRRLAAAQHDIMKATGQVKGTRRGDGNSAGSSRISTVDFHHHQQQQQQQHPVAVAFATGTDSQLASVLNTELSRLGDLAQTDPEKYAALAEECKLWAAGATTSVAGLTASDLERAQFHLKNAMQHMPFSGSGGGASGGPSNSGRGYRAGTNAGVPMPDPRASSYFIQPGSNGGGGGGNPRGAGAASQQQQQHQLFTNQYYNGTGGPGPSRLHNTSSFAPGSYQPRYYNGTTGSGGGSGNGSVVVNHRYPRRSSRARNAKRDDMYLTLDSDDDGDERDNNNTTSERDEEEDTQDGYTHNEDGGGGGGGGMGWNSRRGPGRPRKMNTTGNGPSSIQHTHQHTYQTHQQQQQQQYSPNVMLLQHPRLQQQQQQHHRMTPPSISPAGVGGAGPSGAPGGNPLAFFSPQLGDVLSPFAQFLFEHSPDGHAPLGAAATVGGGGGGNGHGNASGALAAVNGTTLQRVQGTTNAELSRNTAIAGTIAGVGTDPAAAAAGHADVDAVDYAALDDFISGLNFTNDAVLGSPSAMAMLAGARAAAAVAVAATNEAEAAAAAAAAGVAAGSTVAAVPPGMIPTSEAGGTINYTNHPSPSLPTTGGAPTGATAVPSTTAATAAHHHHYPSSSTHQPQPPPTQAQLPILDLAICKPLETPTVAGMLSLGLSKKSPTPITSPLLSPSLLALNF